MSSCRELLLAAALVVSGAACAQPADPYPGIGRAATPKEVAAWDIDVRPDFKGLPKGSGTVAKGMDVWEGRCASCHGVFGESNQVFNPIVGGTTAADIASGRVARLNDTGYPARTTLMKVATLSTLWDYVNRAMPWNQPKSLQVDEVYSVVAYILNLGGIVPDDFTLSDRNVAEVQKRLPNRDGMTTEHGLWPGAGIGLRRPDVQALACMTNCAVEPRVASMLPEFARNAHGNLAEQNRLVGPQRGADTSRPTAVSLAAQAAAPAPAATAGARVPAALGLLEKNGCVACHGVDGKIVGPAFRDVAGRYRGRTDATELLARKILSGGSGAWGDIPMPPQALGESDAQAIARWIAEGAEK